MTDFSLQPLRPADRDRVTQFIAGRWGAPMVVAHGEIFYPLIGDNGIPIRDEIELALPL